MLMQMASRNGHPLNTHSKFLNIDAIILFRFEVKGLLSMGLPFLLALTPWQCVFQ